MTLAELLAFVAGIGAEDAEPVTDEQLEQALADLRAEAAERADVSTDEQLTELQAIREAVNAIRAEQTARSTAAEARAAEAAEALADINDEGGGDEGEPAEPETPADPEAPAEPETPAEPEVPAEEAAAPAGAEGTPVPVAAAATPRIGNVAARRPAVPAPRRVQPNDLPDPARWGLVASANVPNMRPGEPLNDPDKIANAFLSMIEATLGYNAGPPTKMRVARVGQEDPRRLYGPDRYLDGDVNGNGRKIRGTQEALMAAARQHPAGSPASLAAAGGICAPSAVRYDQPVIGTEARPVRDQLLTRFGADRGGVRTLPPPVITDLEGAVGFWSADNDANPVDPTTKPCLTVTCPDDTETLIEAVTKCLKFGNFRARYWAEQIDAWVRLAAVQWARQAEVELLTTIGTASTQITSGQLLGTTRDVLAVLDREMSAVQSFYRTGEGFRANFAAPFWLRDQMRTDLAREMPGSTAERLATADAEIDTFFAVRDVNPFWLLDGEAGQIFGPQGDGPLQGWPSQVICYVFAAGDWLFLDGGTLDLGIWRDTGLIETNDVKMFSESMEGAHFHGTFSHRLTLDTCPDGTTSGTSDIDPCSTGS